MEKFNEQQYRDNLAEDLKGIRKEDKELATKIIKEEQGTSRYQMAQEGQIQRREQRHKERESEKDEKKKQEEQEKVFLEKVEERKKRLEEDPQRLFIEEMQQVLAEANRGEGSVIGKLIGKFTWPPIISNPETASLNYDLLGDPEIISLADSAVFEKYEKWLKERKIEGTPANEVQFFYENYGNDYYIPGEEYAKFLVKQLEKRDSQKVFRVIKEGVQYQLPGSMWEATMVGAWWVSGMELYSEFKGDGIRGHNRGGSKRLTMDKHEGGYSPRFQVPVFPRKRMGT